MSVAPEQDPVTVIRAVMYCHECGCCQDYPAHSLCHLKPEDIIIPNITALKKAKVKEEEREEREGAAEKTMVRAGIVGAMVAVNLVWLIYIILKK
jgi:hypothetical protein